MGDRLQVLVDKEEYQKFKKMAQDAKMSLGSWVLAVLRKEPSQRPLGKVESKLRKIRLAAANNCTTGSVEEILDQSSKGSVYR